MEKQKIINKWLSINTEYYQNYFHDFIEMYCEKDEIKYKIPITNNTGKLGVKMVRKCDLHKRIRKYSNCSELHYWEPIEPHNPYQDSVYMLYSSADNTQDYLKKWLLLILHQKLLTDSRMFGVYYDVFEEVYYQLLAENHMGFGNAKYVLPLMHISSYLFEENDVDLELLLYNFKTEMNYVKANYYFVVFEDRI